ncbi:MAG TPA: hypothetical protein PLT55_03330 [Acidimicrobiia bacterium]|nr:hypothetical protein [Acidimicrobiia bacterium]
MSSQPRAEISSITTQLEEIMNRVVQIGDNFRHEPDSGFVNECNNAERSLMSAIRSIERAKKQL